MKNDDDLFRKMEKLNKALAGNSEIPESIQRTIQDYERIKHLLNPDLFRIADRQNVAQSILDQNYQMQRLFAQNLFDPVTDQMQKMTQQLAGYNYDAVIEAAASHQKQLERIGVDLRKLGMVGVVENFSKELSAFSNFTAERLAFESVQLLNQEKIQQIATSMEKLSAASMQQFDTLASQLMPTADAVSKLLANADHLRWIARHEDLLLNAWRVLPDLIESFIKESGIDEPVAEEFRRRIIELRNRMPLIRIDERTLFFELIYEFLLKPLVEKTIGPGGEEVRKILIVLLVIITSRQWDQIWPRTSEYSVGDIKAGFNFLTNDGLIECQVFDAHPQNGPDRKFVLLEPAVRLNQSKLIKVAVEIAKQIYPDHPLTKSSDDDDIPIATKEQDPYLGCGVFGIYADGEDYRDYIWVVPIKRRKKKIKSIIIWNEKRPD